MTDGSSTGRDPRAAPGAASARLEAVVRGHVQGVGYRYFVIRTAMGLGLRGWVANLPDGAVRCVAEGPRPVLEAFLDRLRDGPASAVVERVLVAWLAPTGEFASFSIRSGGHPGD
ncbi:MAG: acylphosphatase [Chloroflexi bacterium]|nr:acylphosphatase [Chloroflexota bacterium]